MMKERHETKLANQAAETPPALFRLEDQIAWYDNKSRRAQKAFKGLKIIQIVAAGAIPLITVFQFPYPERINAVLGLIILVVEGLQQLNQYQPNWINYRSTCEALRHEKFLYLAGAGPYGKAEQPLVLLAERIENLISQEHAKWLQTRRENDRNSSEKS